MIKLETRDWVALASAAVGLATFLVFRAKPEPKPKDAPWARSKKKGENGYYYGHQNLTGGYTDGLQASDYAMNGPRKLDSATKKPVAVDSQTAVNKPRAPIASAPVMHSETIKRVTRYAWSDTPTTVKISIEDAWDYSAISEDDVNIARPSDTALTISVKYEGCVHRLALTNLRSPLDDAKVNVRKKRLVVALTKRETLLASDKAWPDLFCSAASFPASDVSAPLAD